MFAEAEAYERFMGRWSRLLAPSLIEFSGVHDGDTVLDVGSGTGSLSAAVRHATKTSLVTGIDPSPEYVRHARQTNSDRRVRFDVGDAQALRLPDAAFDKTLSLLVVNFIPDRERALAEMIRVTKPGGVISAAVWDYGEGMEMLRVFWDEATAFDPSIASRDEKHMPLCKNGELSAAWRAAGLDNVEEVPIVATLHFESFEDYWEPFLLGQGPAGAYTAKLAKDRQADLAARLRKRLVGDHPNPHAFDMRARAWAVKGMRRLPRDGDETR
jgi:SAM-dependent methyltransferase